MIVPLGPILDHFGVIYRPTDSWQKVLCPVHGESVPSCSLNLATNFFQCHACGASGHTLDLIAAKEGITRDQAVDVAKRILGDGFTQPAERVGWRSGRVAAGSGYRPRYNRGWRR